MKRVNYKKLTWAFSALILTLSPILSSDYSQAFGNQNNLEKVNVVNGQSPAFGHSTDPLLSADGRYVVFSSESAQFDQNDINGASDIFKLDRQSGQIKLVSKSSSGAISNGYSSGASISSDARYITFQSTATNLVANDTNNKPDVFLHDTQTNLTMPVSLSTEGGQGNETSGASAISSDGRYVVFDSYASNLVPNDTNNFQDVFVRDTQVSTTTRLGVNGSGVQGNGASRFPEITTDGAKAFFVSTSSNLVANDTNTAPDIFMQDLQQNTIQRVSLTSNGAQAGGVREAKIDINDSGTKVTFMSSFTNLVDEVTGYTPGFYNVFLRDIAASNTLILSKTINGVPGSSHSEFPAISPEGEYITFSSCATNLIAGDNTSNPNCNIFKWHNGSIVARVSKTLNGSPSDGLSYYSDVSSNGSYVAFDSYARNLVTGDTGTIFDIFLHHIPETTPPVVTGNPDRVANSNGWYSADVTIDWTSADPSPSSGAPSDPPSTLATTEGVNVTYTSGQSCDPDNNCSTGSLALSIDKTSPIITASVSPAPTNYGWNNAAATVTFNCSDVLSGVDSCSGPVTLSNEGDNQTVTGTAVDKAGKSSSTSVTVRIDKTNPIASFASGTPLIKRVGQTQTITALTGDTLSGVAGGEFT